MASVTTRPFRIGDTVVEPTLGICRVQGIRNMTVDDINEDYYVFQSAQASVMVPSSQLIKRGIRKPMSKEDIRKMTNTLRSPVTPVRGDARTQYLEYQATLKSGDPTRISKLLRNLFILDQNDELKGKEKELMEKARTFLVEEITFIQGTPKTQISGDIDDSLKQMYKKKLTKEKDATKAEAKAAKKK